MSFNTIIEAEKEADLVVSTANAEAKQSIIDALSNQSSELATIKSQIITDSKAGLVDFETKLQAEVKNERTKSEAEKEALKQSAEKQKESALKQILARFK